MRWYIMATANSGQFVSFVVTAADATDAAEIAASLAPRGWAVTVPVRSIVPMQE